MGILDDVINSTQPRIIKVENDLNNISVVADLNARMEQQIAAIRAGNWDSAEYGRTAEQQIAIIRAANTPEKQAAVLEEMKQLAIRRASLDVTNGKINVMVNVGPNGEKMPWHQLGTMVSGAVTKDEAIELSGNGWEVLKIPASYLYKGEYKESEDTFLLVRADTGAQLGTTGSRYKVVNNREGFDFLDNLFHEFNAKFETAGSVYGGKSVWIQAVLPEYGWEVQNGDRIETYAMFTLDHTGKGACQCIPTTRRAVCANTLRIAVSADRSKGISIRHTGNLKTKLADAQRAMGLTINAVSDMKEASAAMVRKKIDVPKFVNLVLDRVLDVTAEQAALGAELLAVQQDREIDEVKRQIKERKALLDDILERHDSQRCEPHGTVWGGVNAITESQDWRKIRQRGSEANKASRKFESVLYGEADNIKQVAWQYALSEVSA